MRTPAAWLAALAYVAIGAVSAPVLAQTPRTGGGASAQLLQELQQLASERTALQAENEKLKSQLADTKKDRDALKSGQEASVRRVQGAAAELAQVNARRETTERELTQYKAKLQELIGKFRETVQKLRDVEIDGSAAKQSLATRDRELKACVDHNVALYRLNDEVLTHFEQQGFWSRVGQSEPFTKIKHIQNENLIDDYRLRAQDQLAPGAKPGAAPAAPTSRP